MALWVKKYLNFKLTGYIKTAISTQKTLVSIRVVAKMAKISGRKSELFSGFFLSVDFAISYR